MIHGVDAHRVGEETTVIDGRQYLLTFEGWSSACVGEIGSPEECLAYAVWMGERYLKEEWPLYWGDVHGFEMIEGKHDVTLGDFGMTWALWVRVRPAVAGVATV
jgi:hypothetical protein